jgi:hypothetical protein
MCSKGPISIGELLTETAAHNQALLTLILSLPFLLPVPLAGLSIPFGLCIFFIATRMLLGKSLWLPKFLRNRIVSQTQTEKIFSKLRPLASRLSRFVKPRGVFFLNRPGTKKLAYFFISLSGLLLALPLPPGTNAPPALTAVLLSMGVLEHDGLYLILGFLCFFAISILFLTFLWWGYPQVIHWFGY